MLAVAAAAWLSAAFVMRASSDGMSPATAGAVIAFLVAWLIMMAAMMLPTVIPVLLVYNRVAKSRLATFIFATGYLVTWTGFGCVAYLVYVVLEGRLVGLSDVQPFGPIAAATTLGAAALYQLSPVKSVCLKHCRSPLSFFTSHWRSGLLGGLRMGAAHGAFCVGCCTGLMLVLFAAGLMSLGWMVVLSAIIFAEKVAPFGATFSRIVAVALACVAAAIVLRPDLFQLLT